MGIDWGLLIPVGIVILLCAGFALVVIFNRDSKAGKYKHATALQKNSPKKKSRRRREWEENKDKEAEGEK